jgi:hypothetical protein
LQQTATEIALKRQAVSSVNKEGLIAAKGRKYYHSFERMGMMMAGNSENMQRLSSTSMQNCRLFVTRSQQHTRLQ